MTLEARVRRTILEHGLASPDTRVLIALSGGSDSVALAYLLHDLAAAGLLTIAGAAHFNHQLRSDADDDARFCQTVADSLGWPLVIDRENVAARARKDGASIELAARAARYAFLDRAAAELHADRIALGHTRDDQAETFLLRLVRGAGSRGLAGMHPRRGAMIRPLIDCRREELRAYLRDRDAGWHEDASNEDVTIPRNRVRAELLPLLGSRFNPAVVETLADAADIAREEWRVLEDLAREACAAIASRDGNEWRIDAAALNALPVAVARLVLRHVMHEVSSGRHQGFSHIEEVRRLSRAPRGNLHLPAHIVKRVAGELVLTGRSHAGRPRQPAANLFRYSLSIPGEVAVVEAGRAVVAEVAPSLEAVQDRAAARSGVTAIVQLDRCTGGLAVRNRRPGDSFTPLGLGGRKKLQDVFVDRKVPRSTRDHVPLVVDRADRIVWVAGYGIDEEFRVTDPSQAVLVLTLTELGGRG
jgi:tRNA(Ile)-lysidine synthase